MSQDKPGHDPEAEERKLRQLTAAVQRKTPEEVAALLQKYGHAEYRPVRGSVTRMLVVSQIEDVLMAALTLGLPIRIDPEERISGYKYGIIEVSDARVGARETKQDHFSFQAPAPTSRAYREETLPTPDYMQRIEKLGAWVNDNKYTALVVMTPGMYRMAAVAAPAAGDVLYFLMQYLTPSLRSSLYKEGTAPRDIATTAVTAPFTGRILQVPRVASQEPFIIERDITQAVADTIAKFATLKRGLNYHIVRQKNAIRELGPSKDERLGFTQAEKDLIELDKQRKQAHDAMHAAAIVLDRAASRRYGYGAKLKGLEDAYEGKTALLAGLKEEKKRLVERDTRKKGAETYVEWGAGPPSGQNLALKKIPSQELPAKQTAVARAEISSETRIAQHAAKDRQIADAEKAVTTLRNQITALARLRADVTGLDHKSLHLEGAQDVPAAVAPEIADRRTRDTLDREVAEATNAYADAFDVWEAAEKRYQTENRMHRAVRSRDSDVQEWSVGQKKAELGKIGKDTDKWVKEIQDKIHALPITDASLRTITQLQQAFSGLGLTAEIRIRDASVADSRRRLDANTRPVEEKLHKFSLPDDREEQAPGFFLRRDLIVMQVASVSILRHGVQLPIAPGLRVGDFVTEGQPLTIPTPEANITEALEEASKPVTRKRPAPEGPLARGIAVADRLYLTKAEKAAISEGKQTLLLTRNALVYSTPSAVASFQVGEETFYATPVPASDGAFRQMSASGAAKAVGSVEALFAGLGYLPLLGERTNEQLEGDFLSADGREHIASIIENTFKLKSSALREWLRGGSNMSLYKISRKPPTEAVDGYIPVTAGAGASDRALIEKTFLARLGASIPAVSPTAKPVPVIDIERLQLYVMRQDRPVETADIRVKARAFELEHTIDPQRKAVSLANALARVTMIVLKLKSEYLLMQKEAKGLSKEERGLYPTPAEHNRAEQKALAFGRDAADRAYAVTRAHTKILASLVHGKDEEMAAVNADPAYMHSSPLAKAAVVICKDPELVKRATNNRPLPPGTTQLTPQQLLNMSRPAEYADTGPVAEEIEQIRERMATARVTEDPMFEYLLVAERRAHPLTNAPQGSVRLLLNTGSMSVMAGETGKALGLAIAWYRNAERVGYVPSEFPEAGARGAARKMLQRMSSLSGQTSVAAARAGHSIAPRGAYSAGVSQQGTRPGFNVAAGLGSIQAGKGTVAPSESSFGYIGMNTQRSSRLAAAIKRLPADIVAKVEVPVGRASSTLRSQLDKEALIPHAERPLTISKGREQLDARARSKQQEADSRSRQLSEGTRTQDIVESAFAGSPSPSPAPEGEFGTADQSVVNLMRAGDDTDELFGMFGGGGVTSNPRRYAYASRSLRRLSSLRRNPDTDTLRDVLPFVPDDLKAVYGGDGTAARALGKLAQGPGAKLTEIESILFIGSVCLPVTLAYALLSGRRNKGGKSLTAEDLRSAAACLPVAARASILKERKPPVGFPEVNSDTLTALAQTSIFFGPLYSTNLTRLTGVRGFAPFDATPSGIVAIGLILGPLAQAYAMVLSDYGERATSQERAALEALTREPAIRENIIRVSEYIDTIRGYAYDSAPLPGAARVLTATADGSPTVTKGTGLVLTPESRKLLSEKGLMARVSGAVVQISDALASAESKYAKFVELLQTPTSSRDELSDAKGAYEAAARNLRAAISANANEGTSAAAVTRDLVNARMTQFFAGRALAGSPAESQASRRATLRALHVAARLDYYGYPVYPIDAAELHRRGIGAIDYGADRTLGSRLSLADVGKIISASPTQGGRVAAPSTLDCRPGIRGFRQFNRPFNLYTPPGWGQNTIMNAIWLSPDGNYARIYRLGAPVCSFKRHTNQGGKTESVDEFLREIASNWTLWLTDPEHRRAAAGSKAFSNIIYVGQSGYPFVFRVNAAGTPEPLAVHNFEKRLKNAGGAVVGNNLVRDPAKGAPEHERLKAGGYQVEWAPSESAVTVDAEMFAHALRDIGEVSANETEETLRKILRGTSPETGPDATTPATGDSALLMFPSHRAPPPIRQTSLGGSEGVPRGVTSALDTLYAEAVRAGTAARNVHVLDVGLFDRPLQLAIDYALSAGSFDETDPRAAPKVEQARKQYKTQLCDASAAGYLLSAVVDADVPEGSTHPPFAFWVPGINRATAARLANVEKSWPDTTFPTQAAGKAIGSPELVRAALSATTDSIVIVNTWTELVVDPELGRFGTLPMLIEAVRYLKRSDGLGDGEHPGKRKIYYCNPPGTEQRLVRLQKAAGRKGESTVARTPKRALLEAVTLALYGSNDMLSSEEMKSLHFHQLEVLEWDSFQFNALMRRLAHLPAEDQAEPVPQEEAEEVTEEEEEERPNPARRASRYMAAAYQRTLPFAGWRNR